MRNTIRLGLIARGYSATSAGIILAQYLAGQRVGTEFKTAQDVREILTKAGFALYPSFEKYSVEGYYPPKPYDTMANIIAFENGELDDTASIELFQHLIDPDLVWSLQGYYGRKARSLLAKGLCHAKVHDRKRSKK